MRYTKLNPALRLKSLVRCACGQKLTSDAGPKGKNPKWRQYYACPRSGAEHVRLTPDELHGQFLDPLVRLTPAPGFDADEIRAVLASRRERALGAERTRLAAIKRDQRQATDRFLAVPPTTAVADALTARLAELNHRHAVVSAKVAALEGEQAHQLADEQLAMTRVALAMADLPRTWLNGLLPVRQAIVKLAFPEGLTVAVQPGGSQEFEHPFRPVFSG
jgi:hypothetical protein